MAQDPGADNYKLATHETPKSMPPLQLHKLLRRQHMLMWMNQEAMRRHKPWFLWLLLVASPIRCDDAMAQSICDVPGLRDLAFSSAMCPSRRQFSTGKGLNWDGASGWVKDDACQDLGSAKFCSYTMASFNDGFGVSVITTDKHFDEISSLPALTKLETKRPWKNAGPAFQEEEVPGKGKGLVAARRIVAGELVLARTPAVLVDDEGFRELGEASLTELLVQAIEALPQQHQSKYMNLSTHDVVHSHDERTYQVFAKNNYRIRIANTTDFHATFIDVSRLNHDCRPNCGYQFDSSTLTQKVYAARDILPGEELTVAYTDPVQTRETRQTQLQSNWGFTCTCKHCTGEEDEVRESDERITQIHSLWKELDDYTSASTATPTKAEDLVSLYETEGLKTRIHEAYYRAAIEYNGVGDSNKAARYAMLSILRGQMMAGFDRPFVEKMKELIKDPEKHWSWKFRPSEDVKDEL